MGNLWTITRHTLAESIRRKTAVTLVVLMCVLMLAMPFASRGDNTVSGAVQAFMQYSLNLMGFLLSCVTIFLSKTISDDLTGKQIQVLMTKPLARWQYVLGKWFGIVLLNALVLAIAGGMIYALTMYLAGQQRGLLIAGGLLGLIALIVCVALVRRYRPARFSLKRWSLVAALCAVVLAVAGSGIYGLAQHQATIVPRDQFDAERLENQVLKARHASKFRLPYDELRRMGNAQFEQAIEQGKYRDLTPEQLEKAREKIFTDLEQRWRSVAPTESRLMNFEDVRCSRSPEETVHLSYRLRVFNYSPDEVLRCYWLVGDRRKGATEYTLARRDAIDRRHTLPIPADAVAPDGTLQAIFVNSNPWQEFGEEQTPNVALFEGDNAVELLFSVSTYGSNLVRALALVFCRLAFLAAFAVLLTTALSFPVACFAALVGYLVAAIPGFLDQALEWLPEEGLFKWFAASLRMVLWVIHTFFIPRFTLFDGVPTLVEGRNVTLMWVLMGVGRLVLIQAAAMLLVACLLFRRREVSEISL